MRYYPQRHFRSPPTGRDPARPDWKFQRVPAPSLEGIAGSGGWPSERRQSVLWACFLAPNRLLDLIAQLFIPLITELPDQPSIPDPLEDYGRRGVARRRRRTLALAMARCGLGGARFKSAPLQKPSSCMSRATSTEQRAWRTTREALVPSR